MRDLHTTKTTGHERFPSYSGHGTKYFRFVLTFSFFTSKQLVFLPICFTVCAIIAKNIGLSDFEINYKADVPGEKHATVQSYCITIEIGLRKTKHPWKRFQNFRQSCVLLTDRIEIHQSQPDSMTERLEGHTSGCNWWIWIRSVNNTQD